MTAASTPEPRYAQPDDVREALSRDYERGSGPAEDDTAAALSDERLVDAILTAEGDVDSALAGVYAVPFPTPAPALIKGITVALAGFLLDLTDRQSEDINDRDPVAQRAAWARQRLNALRRNDASLPGLVRIDVAEATEGVTALEPINGVSGLFLGVQGVTDGRGGEGYAPWELRRTHP